MWLRLTAGLRELCTVRLCVYGSACAGPRCCGTGRSPACASGLAGSVVLFFATWRPVFVRLWWWVCTSVSPRPFEVQYVRCRSACFPATAAFLSTHVPPYTTHFWACESASTAQGLRCLPAYLQTHLRLADAHVCASPSECVRLLFTVGIPAFADWFRLSGSPIHRCGVCG